MFVIKKRFFKNHNYFQGNFKYQDQDQIFENLQMQSSYKLWVP